MLSINPLIPISIDKPIEAENFTMDANESSYMIAHWIMKVVNWLLSIFGLEHNQTIVTLLYAAVVLGIAILIGYAAKYLILELVKRIARRWSNDMYQAMTTVHFFTKLCKMIPAIVFLILIRFTISSKNTRLSA